MLLIILLILLFLLFIKNNLTDAFSYLRSTKRMSYDFRGDPIIIPREEYIWNNTE